MSRAPKNILVFLCAFVVTVIAGVFDPVISSNAAEKTEAKTKRSANDQAQATKAHRFKLLVFSGVPQKEGAADDQKPVFTTIVTANKAFEFKVKEGLGASGTLREDKDGRLHFKGQVNMSPGVGFFDQPRHQGRVGLLLLLLGAPGQRRHVFRMGE